MNKIQALQMRHGYIGVFSFYFSPDAVILSLSTLTCSMNVGSSDRMPPHQKEQISDCVIVDVVDVITTPLFEIFRFVRVEELEYFDDVLQSQ